MADKCPNCGETLIIRTIEKKIEKIKSPASASAKRVPDTNKIITIKVRINRDRGFINSNQKVFLIKKFSGTVVVEP